MLRYRTGVASSPAAGRAMAQYLSTETLRPEKADLARYYAGEVPHAPETVEQALGQLVAEDRLSFSEAFSTLMSAELTKPESRGMDVDDLGNRVSGALLKGIDWADAVEAVVTAGGAVASVRPDMHPRLADRLGVDTSRPPMLSEVGHLLNGLRADGRPIVGKQRPRCSTWIVERRRSGRR